MIGDSISFKHLLKFIGFVCFGFIILVMKPAKANSEKEYYLRFNYFSLSRETLSVKLFDVE